MIDKIQERNNAPTQNLQMISIEPRPIAAINVVTWSGAMTHLQNAERQLDEDCVLEKVPSEHETVMETQRDDVSPSTVVVHAQQHQQESQL